MKQNKVWQIHHESNFSNGLFIVVAESESHALDIANELPIQKDKYRRANISIQNVYLLQDVNTSLPPQVLAHSINHF